MDDSQNKLKYHVNELSYITFLKKVDTELYDSFFDAFNKMSDDLFLREIFHERHHTEHLLSLMSIKYPVTKVNNYRLRVLKSYYIENSVWLCNGLIAIDKSNIYYPDNFLDSSNLSTNKMSSILCKTNEKSILNVENEVASLVIGVLGNCGIDWSAPEHELKSYAKYEPESPIVHSRIIN